MRRSSHAIQISALAAVIGAFIGALVFAEPYLVNALSHKVDMSFMGTNVFKLFDFELTAALFVTLVFLLILTKVLSRTYSIERIFIILYIVGLQTRALTTFGRFDLSEIVIMFFAVIFFIRLLDTERRLTLTAFDLLNLFFITSLVLPAVNNGMLFLVDAFVTGTKMILVTFLFVNYLEDKELVKFAIKWFIIMTLISAFIAIGQAVLYMGTGHSIIGFVDHSQMKFLFEDTPFGPMLRVPAFFGTYKPFTFFLDASILLLLNALFYCRLALREKFYLSAAIGVMFTAVVLTFSKDALLALFIGSTLSILVWRPGLILHWLALALLVFAVAEALGLVNGVLDSLQDGLRWHEDRIRVLLAKYGIMGFIYKHPWVGVGPRNTPLYTAHFYRWPAHNIFIQAADSGGVVGLIAYLGLIGYTFKCLFKVVVNVSVGSDRWIGMGLLTGFIAFVIMGQFHPVFLERFLWLYMGLAMAVELKYVDPGPGTALKAA